MSIFQGDIMIFWLSCYKIRLMQAFFGFGMLYLLKTTLTFSQNSDHQISGKCLYLSKSKEHVQIYIAIYQTWYIYSNT